jgi:hypothetical protein
MSSPLKSPIVSRKSIATLKKIIPEGSVVHSFLLYDGNIEVELSKSKRFVVAHTSRYVNYEFWKCLQADPERLSEVVQHFSPIESDNIFDILQKQWAKYPDPFIRSGIFYLLNQSSDLNYISCGKLVENLDLTQEINKMKKYSNADLHVQLDQEENYMDAIENIQTECDYIFLPIGPISLNFLEDSKSEGLEQTKIIHKDVKHFLDTTEQKVVVLYQFSERVLQMYKDHTCLIIDQWGRLTDVKKFAKEILVANF